MLFIPSILSFLLFLVHSNNMTQCPYGSYFYSTTSTSFVCIQCPSTCPSCKVYKFDNENCPHCPSNFKLSSTKKECLSCDEGMNRCESEENISCLPNYLKDKDENNKTICASSCERKNCENCQKSNKKSVQKNEQKKALRKIGSKNQSQEEKNSAIQQKKGDCPISLFYNEQNKKQEECSPQCSTCINSADQCTKCNKGYTKSGWKCVTQKNILFEMSITIQGTLKEKKNSFRQQIGQFRFQFGKQLKNGYESLSNTTYLTITSASIQNDKVLLEGIIDNIFSKNVVELSQKLEDKFCKQRVIGTLKIGEMEIEDFTFFPQVLESQKLVKKNASKRRCQNLTEEQRLAIIIVSSIFGFFLILTILLCMWENRKHIEASINLQDFEEEGNNQQKQKFENLNLKSLIESMIVQIEHNEEERKQEEIESERKLQPKK